MRAMRAVIAIGMLLVAALGRAETLVVAAKILSVSERGYTLQVGTEPLAVEDSSATRFWLRKAIVRRDAFTVGQKVSARVKTDADPPQLKEMADPTTQAWLERIRKEPQEGTIERVDAKSLVLKLADGTPFTYRLTEKSAIRLTNGDPSQATSLKAGQKVFAKGRLLSNLDTWLVEVRDHPFEVAKAKSGGTKAPAKPKVLPDRGTVEVKITGHAVHLRMIDGLMGIQSMHFVYDLDTKFRVRGKKGSASDVRWGVPAKIAYTRDRFGRLRANTVDLFP